MELAGKWNESAAIWKCSSGCYSIFCCWNILNLCTVRAELSRWILTEERSLSVKKSGGIFNRLRRYLRIDRKVCNSWLSFGYLAKKRFFLNYGMQEIEKERILNIFQSTTYLAESINSALYEKSFDLTRFPIMGYGFCVCRLIRNSRHTVWAVKYKLRQTLRPPSWSWAKNPDFRPKARHFFTGWLLLPVPIWPSGWSISWKQSP